MIDQFVEPGEMPEEERPASRAVQPWYKRPDFTQARTIKELGGTRPPLYNLRDHEELDGRKVAIVQVRYNEGEFGQYAIIAAFFIDPPNSPDKPAPVVLMTGSEDILGRLAQFADVIDNGTPLIGVLRHSGRAWFLD